MRSALLWGGFGFVTGALFWHAVGFWTFVSDVVLNRDVGSTAALATPAHAELPIIYLIDPASCTALELDRATSRTAVRPCPRDGLALRLEASRDRQDLALLTHEALRAAGYRAP